MVLLILPALPVIGRTVNGARLWVGIGPLQFQPGEFAKLFLIVFLAGYLREKREVLAGGRIKDFGPLLVIWGAAMAVLVQTNDLGSALLYFGIFLGMLYVATDRPLYAGAGLALFVAGAAAAYRSSRASRPVSRTGSTRGPTRRAPATRSSSRRTRSRAAASSARGSARGRSPRRAARSSSPS